MELIGPGGQWAPARPAVWPLKQVTEIKTAPIGVVHILTDPMAVVPADFTGWTWQSGQTDLAINGGAVPEGTLVERMSANLVLEHHRPGGGLAPIDAADEAKSIPIGAFAIATEDLDLAPSDFTGWTWITDFTGSIAASGGTVPAGTIVERTGATEITERSRRTVENIMESDGIAGDFGFDPDWNRHERYEVVISTAGAISFRASTDLDLWGTQTSSLDASSQYNVDGSASTFKQLVPSGQFRMTLVRVGSGTFSFDLGAGAVNVPGVGNVQEFIKASGYVSGTRPARVDFRLASASNSISVVAYGRRA